MHAEHDHFAVCCETIFLKRSSVAVVDDSVAVVLAADGAVVVGAAKVGTADVVVVDNDDDAVESTVGLALPKANVPNGAAGLVPVVGLPNGNIGAAAVVVATLEVAGVVVDVATAVDAATGFEPNKNFPLGAPKSMPPLPNENIDFGVDASLVKVAAVGSLSLAC